MSEDQKKWFVLKLMQAVIQCPTLIENLIWRPPPLVKIDKKKGPNFNFNFNFISQFGKM